MGVQSLYLFLINLQILILAFSMKHFFFFLIIADSFVYISLNVPFLKLVEMIRYSGYYGI